MVCPIHLGFSYGLPLVNLNFDLVFDLVDAPLLILTYLIFAAATSTTQRSLKKFSETPCATNGKAYIFRITCSNDKHCFPIEQGALIPDRVRLLLSDGQSCYRIRRTGEHRRKSVRGCIVGPDIAVLSFVIVRRCENEILGLTDTVLPKRATKISKFFNWNKEDDVRKYVVRREVKSSKKEDAKPYTKAPEIQRLITPLRLQRDHHLRSLKRRRLEHQKEQKADANLAKRVFEKKAKAAAVKASHKATTASNIHALL
ncbi:hypothetical protein NP233_g12416 [Leucocoprinus birnbaumii]|uniref:40S ribosomal protein S6 n=1 Tax=Leucocoprinus birnbaumii TaxID=56174 RepID=A0AAD5YKG3_9AGAR|nr:hypothetical protein NP233_g12416 [Leucocoprinus birnbaumii]